MVPTDPIADFLTRIRNALKARHPSLEVPASEIKVKIAEILKKEGFISSFRLLSQKPHSTLHVTLRYRPDGRPMIREIERLSKPGARYYSAAEEIPVLGGGVSTTIVSTSRGVMTDREAREAKVGGELICRVM